MQIGILGFGRIGKQHYNTLKSMNKVSMIHIYDPFAVSPNEVLPKAVFHVNLENLFKVSQGIIIATPNHLHTKYILLSLKHNVHLLCEKPLCCNNQEIAILENEVNNKFLFNVGFNYRFLSVVKSAKKFIDQIGNKKITQIRLKFYKNSAYQKKEITWRESGTNGLSSGSFGDLGIHLIDLMCYLLGSYPKKNTMKLKLYNHVPFIGSKKVMVDDAASLKGSLNTNTNFEILTSKSCMPFEKGFEILIKGEGKTFQYHSSDPSYYKIYTKQEIKKIKLKASINLDPKDEVYGWSDSFSEQHKLWLKKIQTKSTVKSLAGFSEAVAAQKIFCDSVELYQSKKKLI